MSAFRIHEANIHQCLQSFLQHFYSYSILLADIAYGHLHCLSTCNLLHVIYVRTYYSAYLSVHIFLNSVVVGDVYLVQVYGVIDVSPHVVVFLDVPQKPLKQ